jgi:hypothetical protein
MDTLRGVLFAWIIKMDSDQTLAYWIVIGVLIVVLPLMKWKSDQHFKA